MGLAALQAVALTPTEQGSGYTSRATDGGPDVEGLFTSAITDLQACISKLNEMVAVMPSGSNKTAISTQITNLS